MRRLLQDLVGILGAFVAWWSSVVLIGLLMYAIWPPPPGPFGAGISLEPQNIPGNAFGFVLALYAFRAVTTKR